MPDVKKNTVSVELTATQCLILKNFIEDELFPVIRSNHELGSFAWLSDLVDAHRTLVKAVAEYEADKA